MTPNLATWGIAALATLGVIARPFRLPEFVWAIAGALLLVVFGAISWPEAVAAVAKGTDVYLFLIGMMLLAELARLEGLFDYLAAIATRRAKGSPGRLFAIIYGVGILVTIFLSNDATAVVLTPAVYAVTKAAKVKPLPYLLICAFIANAASFVLPISNPANLVIYGDHMPTLPAWLAHFALPSIVAIATTFLVLWLTQRRALGDKVGEPPVVVLSRGGQIASFGLIVTATVLLVSSALGWQLGLPTFIAGVLVAVLVLGLSWQSPLPLLRGISWSALPLVAGLFVLVEGLNRTGLLASIAEALHHWSEAALPATVAASGLAVGLGSNLINNLPMGLIAATVGHDAQAPAQVTEALLVGVDLGPNLSVTGSLATILWLIALRREGLHVGGWAFLRLGLLVMPPALILALLALVLEPR
ncbi:MAG TPA: arsenic transporter [Devosiaceae bacterium]|nr:arsenic transporter [Devosiaceae bacterium]